MRLISVSYNTCRPFPDRHYGKPKKHTDARYFFLVWISTLPWKPEVTRTPTWLLGCNCRISLKQTHTWCELHSRCYVDLSASPPPHKKQVTSTPKNGRIWLHFLLSYWPSLLHGAVLLEKLTVAQLANNWASFYSTPCKLSNVFTRARQCRLPEPYKYSSHLSVQFKIHFNIILPCIPTSFTRFFPSVFQPIRYTHLYSLQLLITVFKPGRSLLRTTHIAVHKYWILKGWKKLGVRVWSGRNWLRIHSSEKPSWTR